MLHDLVIVLWRKVFPYPETIAIRFAGVFFFGHCEPYLVDTRQMAVLVLVVPDNS